MRVLTLLLASVACLASDALAQDPTGIFAGDSIRVDGEIVGRVLSIQGSDLTLVSRAAPRCRAGEGYGDAPICDPAPIQRRRMSLDDITVERRMEKGSLTTRTIVGGVLGAAAFGTVGYFLGPTIGFGKVDGCIQSEATVFCTNPRLPEDIAAEQEMRDHRRGAFFFGVIGGSFTAIMVRKFSVGWVQVYPAVPVTPDEPWGVSFAVPAR